MKVFEKAMVICDGFLAITSFLYAIQHIGYTAGWSGEFFQSGLSNSTIICNALVCSLFWLGEVLKYAEKHS